MPQVPLRLCAPRLATPGPVWLRLGGGDPCIVHLPGLVANIDLRTYAAADMGAALLGATGDIKATYDHAVWRGIGSLNTGAWQQAAAHRPETVATHEDSARHRAAFGLTWAQAARDVAEITAAHTQMARMPRPIMRVVHESGADMYGLAGGDWAEMLRRPRPSVGSGWADGLDLLHVSHALWQDMHRRPRPQIVAPWGIGAPLIRRFGGDYGLARMHRKGWASLWREGLDIYGWGGPWWPTPPGPPTPPPYVGCYPPPRLPHLAFFEHLHPGRRHLVFRCLGGGGVVVPVLRSYIVIHDIDLYRLPDLHPIPAQRVSLSLDADAWTWAFSATLLGKDARDAIMPDADGTPVTLAVHIDGHVWHVLAETWSEDRSHGRRAIEVSGRGLSAWLASPYATTDSGATTAAMTLQQIVEAHLPIGSGWVVDWDAPDWLVTAGAWSWQGQSPIQAIHAIAKGVGLMVVPARDQKRLRILPRYPVMPWDYASATPDLVIPSGAILRLGRQHAVATQANGVYVHGVAPGGILALVKRTGTAGDRLAQTEQHPLITHTDAARTLGRRILAGQHQQPEVRHVTTLLGGLFPLANLGQLLRIEDGAKIDLGIINAVQVDASIDVDRIQVRQTLTIGEDTPNVWAGFARLLPGSPLLAGQIVTDHSDGTVTVQLIDGGLIRVRGEGAVGQRVYVRDHAIEGAAPEMSGTVIEV